MLKSIQPLIIDKFFQNQSIIHLRLCLNIAMLLHFVEGMTFLFKISRTFRICNYGISCPHVPQSYPVCVIRAPIWAPDEFLMKKFDGDYMGSWDPNCAFQDPTWERHLGYIYLHLHSNFAQLPPAPPLPFAPPPRSP